LSDSQVILIVEDAVELAQIAQIALHRMGLETHHAPNGQRALDFLASNRPDLMLLDIGLPGMSGWDILEALKTNENADFPIIILTASGDPVNRLIGRLQERVIRYMVKPFSVDDLSRAVREALGTAS
jgi:two-component system catabolic regulation response regulator CreB